MRKHIMAITYPPKIEPVMRGLCTMTTRPGWHREVGDEILIHTWDGKPYRSKWGNRIRWEIIGLMNIKINAEGIDLYSDFIEPTDNHNDNLWIEESYRWEQLDSIARMEFIEPPTGLAFRDVLKSMYGELKGQKMQIISGMVIE